MSQESCQRRDPVELLLKGILHSALLCAGVCALAGCADTEKPDTGTETPDGSSDDAGSATTCVPRTWVDASALARARGGEPVEARVVPFTVRTLEEVARENAIEGCVRETYGALVGAHQALSAEDLELRQAMQAIAEDEARHAALSHQVDAWIMERLSAAARERV